MLQDNETRQPSRGYSVMITFILLMFFHDKVNESRTWMVKHFFSHSDLKKIEKFSICIRFQSFQLLSSAFRGGY
jgi:hypothetical protein